VLCYVEWILCAAVFNIILNVCWCRSEISCEELLLVEGREMDRERERENARTAFNQRFFFVALFFSFLSPWMEWMWWECEVVGASSWTELRRVFNIIFFFTIRMLCLLHIRSEKLSSLLNTSVRLKLISENTTNTTKNIEKKKFVQFKLECYSEAKRSLKLARATFCW
jgi:hypothetical protein